MRQRCRNTIQDILKPQENIFVKTKKHSNVLFYKKEIIFLGFD